MRSFVLCLMLALSGIARANLLIFSVVVDNIPDKGANLEDFEKALREMEILTAAEDIDDHVPAAKKIITRLISKLRASDSKLPNTMQKLFILLRVYSFVQEHEAIRLTARVRLNIQSLIMGQLIYFKLSVINGFDSDTEAMIKGTVLELAQFFANYFEGQRGPRNLWDLTSELDTLIRLRSFLLFIRNNPGYELDEGEISLLDQGIEGIDYQIGRAHV